jgi:predicted ATPase
MHLKSVHLHPQRYPSRNAYPFNLPVFHRTEHILFDTPVTLFVGENGTGKSTLLEALARKCGIHIWEDDEKPRFDSNPLARKLPDYLSVQWTDGRVPGSFFGSSVFQDFVRILDGWASSDPGQFDYFGGKSLAVQSHGQSIMSFFRSRYTIKGLYFLDEPETALSPKSQIELLDLMTAMGRAGHAQFIAATHSPILLSCPGAKIYSFDHIPVQPMPYTETGHYRLYKRFLENEDFRSNQSGGDTD